MKRRCIRLATLVCVLATAFVVAGRAFQSGLDIPASSRRIHMSAIVVDTHADTPQRMLFDKTFDLGARHADGNLDIPRMREGGLDAEFFSIWVPSEMTGPPAVKRAMDLIDAVREATRTRPDDLVFARTVDDVRRAVSEHKIAALMGMEGGHMIDDDLGLLRNYAALGIRYLTLTHFKNNNWADSSTDKPAHNGLTSFGKDVVRELNRLGVMVDVSHVSDKTFFDVIEVTKAPVIASHSSCRAIANHPRNMTDEMMRVLAKNDGVIQINYEMSFLSEEYRKAMEATGNDVVSQLDRLGKECKGDDSCVILAMNRISHDLMAAGKLPRVSWEKIVEHIDHAVKVAGIDHVGLGSDFDGATMPFGMEDVSMLPRLTDALLKKGYSEADVDKILGGNLLRVMWRVEQVARTLNEFR